MITISTRGGRRARAAAAFAMLLAGALAVSGAGGAGAAPEPTSVGGSEPVVLYQVERAGTDPVTLAAELLDAGFEVSGRTTNGVEVTGVAATRADLASAGVDVLAETTINPFASGDDADVVAGEQDPILPKKLDGKTYKTFYGGYRTVAAYLKFSDDLAKAYPTFVQTVDYGDSYDGDPLRAVCITADADQGCQLDPDVDKARYLLATQIHARELTTSEVAWRFMTYLLDGYKQDAQVRGLLDSAEVWVVPQINPDGIELVQHGIKDEGLGSDSPAWQRKNTNPGTLESCPPPWAGSHKGVDLNRNWGYHWGEAGSTTYECGETYRGVAADSEPETEALEGLLKDLFRDQRKSGEGAVAPDDTTGAFLTLHSAANLALFPWGYDSTIKAPNDEGLRSFAFRASYYNHYPTGQPGEILYNASGNTDDWTYATLGIAAGTWELGPGGGECAGFHPNYSCQDAFFELNLPALMYQAVAARAPYMYALGPTTTAAKAKLKGSKVKITIDASDAALGAVGPNPPDHQNVTAARVWVGKAPWEAGAKSTKMSIKGSGDTVKANVKVKAGAKKQLAYTQAKDADGNWGPVRAVWVPKA